jgi:RNA polymerase sigma-70 factor (ECF subfamily)
MTRSRHVGARTGSDPGAGLRALLGLVADALAECIAPPVAAAGAGVVSMSALEAPMPGRAIGVGHGRPPAHRWPDEPTDIPEEHSDIWDLVRRAQSGDGEAFGRLYDRYVDTVYRFIYFRVNDRGLAEDFTSETFLRALRRISTISYQGRDVGAWFVTIARNIVLDHLKSARHRLETTTAETPESEDRAPSPETTVLEAMTTQRLLAAVRSLGEEQRECIVLRFLHGFSVSETAAVMGKNSGAVKALQYRAVRSLARVVTRDVR